MNEKDAPRIDVGVKTAATKAELEARKKRTTNLVILGVGAVLVAFITTTVSLVIYHNSGDIYLDRSRPGYLPDAAEIEEGEDLEYVFDKTGKMSMTVLEEYLKNLEAEAQAIDAFAKPFDAGALSDERLGIPESQSGFVEQDNSVVQNEIMEE